MTAKVGARTGEAGGPGSDGSPSDGPRSVLLVGATGLVGGECLQRLSRDPFFERLVVLTRRPLPLLPPLPDRAPRLEEHVIDFDRLEDHAELAAVDRVICALGTTIRKAGSRDRFREVDYGYPALLARLAVERGARHFLLVSAIGADPGSRIFYNRVKGELEEAVRALPYRSVTLLRPSLLLGDRKEFRLGEEVAKRLSFLLPSKWRPVAAGDVAAALVHAAKQDRPGERVIESRDIPALARG